MEICEYILRGYDSELERSMGQIAFDGMEWLVGGIKGRRQEKKANKFYSWIIRNVFSICGII